MRIMKDTNGNIYGPIKDAGGIKKVNYDTEQIDRSFGVNGSFFAPDSYTCFYGRKVTSMKAHNGYLYVAAKKNYVFRINLTTGICDDWKEEIKDPRAIIIRNNILYVFSGSINQSNNNRPTLTIDLSTNTKIDCGDIRFLNNPSGSSAMTIDASGNNLYYQNRYYIYKRSINNSRSLGNATTLSGPRYDWYAYGLEAHPTDNNVLYYSRNIIPWNKKGEIRYNYIYKTFTGIYVFNRSMLEMYGNMDDTELQCMEDCEQLKILENGYKIKSYSSIEYNEISLNTEEDYKYLLEKYK